MSKINVEALIAKKDTITNKAIKGAISELERKQEEAQQARLIEQISRAQEITQTAVDAVRRARKEAQRKLNYLKQVAEAERVFLINADWDIYKTAITIAEQELYK